MGRGGPAPARRSAWASALLAGLAGVACERAPSDGLDPSASPDAEAPADMGPTDVGRPAITDAGAPPVAARGPLDLGFGAVRLGATATRTVELLHAGAPALYRVTAPPPCANEERLESFCHRAVPRRVEDGEVFAFDVVYRPRAATGPGERDRAEVVIEREGDASWRIVVDGTSPAGAPVRCFGPAGLGTVHPGACVPFAVRCGVDGPTEATLTDLRIESSADVRRVDGAPWPSREAPVSLGPPETPLPTWRYEVCARGLGPFEAQIVWEVETDGERREGRSEPTLGRTELIEVAMPASVEVPLLHGKTSVAIENVGPVSVEIERTELTGPFQFGSGPSGPGDPTGQVLSSGASWLATIDYDVPAFAGAAPEGRLDVFVRGLDAPVSTRLLSAPAWSPTCDLELPDDVDLGVIAPRLVVGDPDGRVGPRIRTNGFVLPVRNLGPSACVLEARVEGVLDEGWALGRRTSSAARDWGPLSAAFWIPAGGTARLWAAPSFSAPPGLATGSLSLRVPGSDGVLGTVDVTAEITVGGAEILIEGVGPDDGACGNDVGFRVEIPAGPEVRSARLIGADEGASVSSSLRLPATPPLEFDVELGALDGGARLEVETALGAVVVPLAVSSTPVSSRRVDRFQMFGRPPVDILFVLDDSASMTRFRDNLAANLADFRVFAGAQALDYRLFVAKTTRRDPVLQLSSITGRPYLGPEAAPSEFAAWTDVAEADAGSGIEFPLERALEAVDAAGPSLRADAALSVIVIADETDRSPTTNDVAVNALLSVKGFRNTQLFAFNAITGLELGCVDREGRVAEANARLVELTELTGGVSASLCTVDWSRTLEDLSRVAFGFKSRFFLTDQPEPPTEATIRVELDGVELQPREASGRINWTYDFATNSISFTPLAVPGPGSHIRVEYDTDGCP